ncbi:hypothetical protein CNEO4_220115 [Clostridium neonatale]|nr:hypothetical protein CNEO4_220115 [Clostridium neonatale]
MLTEKIKIYIRIKIY